MTGQKEFDEIPTIEFEWNLSGPSARLGNWIEQELVKRWVRGIRTPKIWIVIIFLRQLLREMIL